jgi:hypothetical protein
MPTGADLRRGGSLKKVDFDELFYQLRRCHHKAVETGECQEAIMAHHLLAHCDIYLKPAEGTEQANQPDSGE